MLDCARVTRLGHVTIKLVGHALNNLLWAALQIVFTFAHTKMYSIKLACLRTTEPLFRTYEPVNLRTTEPLEQKSVSVVVGLTNLRTHGPSE